MMAERQLTEYDLFQLHRRFVRDAERYLEVSLHLDLSEEEFCERLHSISEHQREGLTAVLQRGFQAPDHLLDRGRIRVAMRNGPDPDALAKAIVEQYFQFALGRGT